jgi:Carboxypeptidase regulatory-like domain
MQMLKRLWLVIAIVGYLSLAIGLRAQTTTGLITGVVADSTGAVLPGAQVSVVNRDTGQERIAVSDSSGLYVVPQLAPGAYTLTAKKEGFASIKQDNIQLLVNQSLTIDLKFSVASSAQTIEVNSAPPMLNTTSSTLSDVIEHQEIVDLPLNGREFTQLALLTPGAAPQSGGQQSGFTVALGAGGISPAVSGQRANQNNFTIDGVLNNDIYTNVWSISPPPDAIEEFNVQAHITDAQFAISSGSNINLVTRSGTNQFHGDLWEFFRSSYQEQYLVFRLLGGISLLPGRHATRRHAYTERNRGRFLRRGRNHTDWNG